LAQLTADGHRALSFFGHSAISRGAFHEISNLAAIWRLPIVRPCENKQFAMPARARATIVGNDLAPPSHAYGLPRESLDETGVRAACKADTRLANSAWGADAARFPHLTGRRPERRLSHEENI
jgi:TPP-dependent pyruvate/acetoin dehydrogenase alpha subunit